MLALGRVIHFMRPPPRPGYRPSPCGRGSTASSTRIALPPNSPVFAAIARTLARVSAQCGSEARPSRR